MPLGEGPGPSIRRTLFGDMALADWCGGRARGEPWARFARARDLLAKEDRDRAAAELERIVATAGLESRHYIQFGQGTFDAFAGDPLAANVLGAATALMQQLIEKKP